MTTAAAAPDAAGWEVDDLNSLRRAARSVVEGADITVPRLRELADALRDADAAGLVAELLVAVSRRALHDGPGLEGRAALATDVLRDHQQFSYARRLLGIARHEGPDSERLRQQHALCTYKDLELPAAQRFDRALAILQSAGPLEGSSDAETLGLAGAVFKRRWETDGKRVDLESALWCCRRGFAQVDDPMRWYAGINAAFVADRLAELENQALGRSGHANDLRQEADEIRRHVVEQLAGGDGGWADATLGEALFGLGRFDEAAVHFAAVGRSTKDLWRHETTATQVAVLARSRGVGDDEGAQLALSALVGGSAGAVRRASLGKVGLALSGGGFRASLFHLGVLARLAECNVLRHVEVLSCVSGGSILGAAYYLKLRQLLQDTPDEDVTDLAYVDLVHELVMEFFDGVRKDLRRQLTTDPAADVRMLVTKYSRTDRAGELLEKLFYSRWRTGADPWRMPDLLVRPAGRGEGFTLRYENWRRAAKVPMLVLNATTLNTGHNWQFTATGMGEPPSTLDGRLDASRRLRRVRYCDAPNVGDLRAPALGKAVAASACVPGLFPPITLTGLYDDTDVELVDGGVHDNQGTASLLEQDCTVLLISDASGQLRDDEGPSRLLLGVATRSNSILMKRVRGAQFGDVLNRVRAGALRGVLAIHLTKGLSSRPKDWSRSQEPWTADVPPAEDDAPPAYGIDANVQLAIAQLRTDLDAFTDDEAYALMAAGYLMTAHDLARDLPQLADVDPALERAGGWPFFPVLTEMTSADAARLVDALRFSHVMFLRGPRAWFARQRDRRTRRP